MIGDAVVDWLASVLESGHLCLLDRAEGVVSSCRPGVDSPDLLPSCKACTSKGVAEPLYLALIASRRFRRCSIRAASSRGSSSGGSIAGASAFLLVLRRC